MTFPFIRNVLLKGILIFFVLSLGIGAIPADVLGKLSLYNTIIPGRLRFPFGETPQRSYNLSLFNLEAMFAAHEISAPVQPESRTRVILLGDSSIWGTLLKPEETLAGRLNAKNLQICGKPAYFYNLGYPTISLTKDVLVLQRALQTKPDLAVWVTTLEAFPKDKQFSSPLAENNRDRLASLVGAPTQTAAGGTSIWGSTIFGRRRELADWTRLQLYGIPWAASGMDQDYPAHYTPAEIDLEADETFHQLKPGDDLKAVLAWDVLTNGMSLAKDAGVPVLLVNEPILISTGKNSNLRYNFYYPRWAYDEYRKEFHQQADAAGWNYVDAWDSVPMDEFTNSAIHLTPSGVNMMADGILDSILSIQCN